MTTATRKPIRQGDRTHRLALLTAERAAIRAELDLAYELAAEAWTEAETVAATAEIDRLADELAGLTGRYDELVAA